MQKEVMRLIVHGREFFIYEDAWHEILQTVKNKGEDILCLLEKAEAIAAQDAKALRIKTKYVN